MIKLGPRLDLAQRNVPDFRSFQFFSWPGHRHWVTGWVRSGDRAGPSDSTVMTAAIVIGMTSFRQLPPDLCASRLNS